MFEVKKTGRMGVYNPRGPGRVNPKYYSMFAITAALYEDRRLSESCTSPDFGSQILVIFHFNSTYQCHVSRQTKKNA